MESMDNEHGSNQLLREMQRPQYGSDFTIVWLANNYPNVEDIEKLNCIVHTSYTFTEINPCIDFINDLKNNKVMVIISDSHQLDIVTLINKYHQIYSIYIFLCLDSNNEWKKVRKVKGIFTDFASLYDQIQLDLQKYTDNNSVTFNLASKDSIQKQDAAFMYAQLLKEILLYRPYEDTDKRDLINFCREHYASSSHDLKLIDEFEREYESSKAIFWYTRDSFMYKMVNKALREQNIDTMYALRAFMHDLHLQIIVPYVEQLKCESTRELWLLPIRLLFRGALIPNQKFNEIKKNVGGLISFNEFLSTSANREVALVFAGQSNDEKTAVLFELVIKSSTESPVPFTNIEWSSEFGSGESEYLFAMGTVFCVEKIKELDDGVWCVQLFLTEEKDEQLTILMNYTRESIDNDPSCSPAYAIGRLLLEMGKRDKAAYYLEQALSVETRWNQKVAIFNDLGTMYDELEHWDQALIYYQRASTILLEYVKEDDSRAAVNYNNIGVIFKKQQKFDEALEYFKRSLQIELAIPNYNPELLSVTCKNVGDIFHVQGQIDQALAYVQKGLDIALEHLPSNHSVVAVCYCSLASIYNGQGDDEKALNAYEKCIEIKLVTLPPDDAELATLYMTIAGLQLILGRPDEAGINSRKALDICIKKFDEQDPQRVVCQKAFDLIHDILPHTQ